MWNKIREILILALTVCMLGCVTVPVMAASGSETSEFTFTNEGAQASGGTGGAGTAKTGDVNVGAYVTIAVIAGVGVVALGVSLAAKRRHGKGA